jgi:hypothetical protein
MSRLPLPFHSDDIAALARSLKGQLSACGASPSHVELLNMLARARGCRNFQHFRAQFAARDRLETPSPVAESKPIDFIRVRRLLRLFDAQGRLVSWPSKHSHQELCLWALWSRLPARHVFTEIEINQELLSWHLFGDYALLRRWMCDYGMVSRTRDGSAYWRIERTPPPDALALIRYLRHEPIPE